MRKAILIFLTILISSKITFAQNDLSEIEKLSATAKVWGFLKYYHPNVADGKYDWDAQLFEILSKVKKSTTKEQLSQIYIDWIDKLGEVKKCKKCAQNKDYEYFEKNFDLNWIKDNTIFTNELSERLAYIEQNRHQGKKYYVSSNGKIGNIGVTNEIDYKGFDWNDENLRLLTLFRYWNIVEYFYPYKYQTDTNWGEVLGEMIPEFLNSKSESDFHLDMLELTVKIDDSHGYFITDEIRRYYGDKWIPAKFKLIDNKAIITGFYDDSLARLDDIRIGDVITKVDDMDVATIFNNKKKYILGSNISRKKHNASNTIFKGSSTAVKIEFSRDNKTRVKTIKRYLLKDLNIKRKKSYPYRVLDGNIGYVNMAALKIKNVSDAMEALIGTKALIFDIRNRPKTTKYLIANYIMSKRNDFFKVTYPDLNYPGKFIWKNGRKCGSNGDLEYKGKVILLVNEYAQSHSELTIMCLQTGDNVTTIGSQTSGADGTASEFQMVGGFKTWMTGTGIFYPDGTETQRKGVKIDIEVIPTIQGIIDGKDEVLEKAIELLNE